MASCLESALWVEDETEQSQITAHKQSSETQNSTLKTDFSNDLKKTPVLLQFVLWWYFHSMREGIGVLPF